MAASGRRGTLVAVALFALSGFGRLPDVDEIKLSGEWSGHLQDVWYDGGNCLYWAQTRSLIKTDLSGKILARTDVADHHAGLEVRNGRLYVAVCPMQGMTKGKTTPDCRVTIGEYDADTLKLLKMHVTDVNDRSGSLCILEDGTFLVGCLRPPDISPSQVRFHHFGKDFRLIKTCVLDNVDVKLGIEVLKRHNGFTYMVPYGMCLKLDDDFKEVARYRYGGAMGLVFDGDAVWIGDGHKDKTTKMHASKLVRCKKLPAGFNSGKAASADGSFVMDFAGGIGNRRTVNYENRLSVGVETVEGEWSFVAKNVDSAKRDVSWGVESEVFAVKEGAEYVVKVRAMGDIKMRNPRPLPCVKWLDADGKPIEVTNALGVTVPASTTFGFETSPSEWRESLGKGVVPAGAKLAKIYIGADKPDLAHGQRMCISRVEYVERRPGVEWAFGDLEPPEVEQLTPSPNEDLRTPVSFRITDASGLDRAKFRCLLDGTDVTARVEWKGDVATYRHASDWERESIHEFTLECADVKGNRCEESRFMAFFPKRSSHDRAQLRDDGVILINGKPVFPVSVSGLTPCPHNGRDLDKAVRELKDRHFSIVSTGLIKGMNGGKWDELADQIAVACEKHGMKTWPHAASQYLPWPERRQKIRMNVVEGRGLSRTFGWNVGDDTADHRTPEELKKDSLLIKAIDGDCLTLSSDSASIPGRVAPFAPYVDIFKCELYPIRSETPQAKELPLLQKNLRIAYSDTVRGGAKAPCIVALLQSFKGWTYWKRYPTYEELRAMTFLSIANRARGVAYYTYFSGNGFGAASTPETFAELCRVSDEVAALEPHLVSRDAKEQPKVEVVEGPKEVPFGFPPVTCLLKESGLLVAVSLAVDPVTVRITMPGGQSITETFQRNGVLVRKIEPDAAPDALPPPKMDWKFGSDAKSLEQSNFGNAVDIETVREGDGFALRVSNRRSPKYPWKTPDGRSVMREVDTSWLVLSDRFEVTPGAEFAVRFRAKCTGAVPTVVASPPPALMWHGADGKLLTTRDAEGKDGPFVTPVPFAAVDGRWTVTVRKGVVPDDARYAVLRLSADQPNMFVGQSVTVANAAYYERENGFGWDFGDLEAPEAERITPSPCADLGAAVSIRMDDPSGIDRKTFRCLLDGTDVTARVEWNGDVFTYKHPVPWATDSLHEFAITCADLKGNEDDSSCFVCFSSVPLKHDAVSVRDDGMTLVGGKPFFPISISSVCACPLNGGDVTSAVRELKEAGFNMLSTYMVGCAAKPQPAFDALISACNRYGMKIFLEPALRTGAEREARMLKNLLAGRSRPCTIGWGIGDDTAMHRSPDEVRRDNLICKAVDPDAITMQSDIAHYAGRYGPYAPYTDMFKIQLYPIVEPDPQPDEMPMIPRDLRFVFGDLGQSGLKNRAVVPTIQFFSGWTRWKRFPTYEEVRAETFLAIANRARGATYYTYWSPNGQGAASTRERFDTLARVTREVAGMSEALASRDAACQPKVEIVSGPKVDAFGQPSISCLLKETGLLVAVNSAAGQVTARFALADGNTFTHVFGRNGVLIR